MSMYTYSEARRRLASLLEEALGGRKVIIRRKDGRLFELRPAPDNGSPLDVDTVDLNVNSDEIVAFILESRREALAEVKAVHGAKAESL